MEQTEPISATENAALPVVPVEPRYDTQRAGRRKVRVIKVPYDQDPMKEKTVFEFGGFVYICYAKKTRGRSMIRCLGLADVEPERPKLDADGMGDAIKEVIDDEIVQEVIKEAEGDG